MATPEQRVEAQQEQAEVEQAAQAGEDHNPGTIHGAQAQILSEI